MIRAGLWGVPTSTRVIRSFGQRAMLCVVQLPKTWWALPIAPQQFVFSLVYTRMSHSLHNKNIPPEGIFANLHY